MKMREDQASLVRARDIKTMLIKSFQLDLVFLIDVTASMEPSISMVRDKVNSIVQGIKGMHPRTVMRLAFVGYRDYHDEQPLHLAAATPAGTPLVAIQRHVAVTLATWDAVWGEYLHPKWAEQKVRLYGAQEKVLKRYFKKLEEEAAVISQQRCKQLVVFVGNVGIGVRGGWGAKAVLRACHKVVERPTSGRPTDRLPGKVVTVNEFRTSSQLSYEQPPAL
ncbi:alpha-protein kinase vwkA [Haematococcus lacustris]|uniref:Alpha-protein kinase vwkA n=1 Tax=Haematococcus lacustris TaxID=44745 RepID=A0A699ZDF4_HAELA|nr:alpha-protein kinase vwkA [Haematococcus lacustris]